jgi:hypothetical protein
LAEFLVEIEKCQPILNHPTIAVNSIWLQLRLRMALHNYKMHTVDKISHCCASASLFIPEIHPFNNI